MRIVQYKDKERENPIDFLFDTERGGTIKLSDCINDDTEYRVIIQDVGHPVNWRKLKNGATSTIIYYVKVCSGFEDMCVDTARNHKFVFPYKVFKEAYIKAKKDIPLTEKDVYDVNLKFMIKPFRIKKMDFILVNKGGKKE